jgi:predicted DNA-binding transcriptional regulator AlpA
MIAGGYRACCGIAGRTDRRWAILAPNFALHLAGPFAIVAFVAADLQRPSRTPRRPSMRPDLAVLPPRFLRTKEAAEFLSLSARTLEKHRTYGTGPAYRKLGGRVVYAVDDLEAWAARGAVTSTSDPRGSILPPSVTPAPPAHAGRYAR